MITIKGTVIQLIGEFLNWKSALFVSLFEKANLYKLKIFGFLSENIISDQNNDLLKILVVQETLKLNFLHIKLLYYNF
jgi:hypothetical protein